MDSTILLGAEGFEPWKTAASIDKSDGLRRFALPG